MFYTITAYNTQPLIAWASNAADVDRYVDWLNRDRDRNIYSASPASEEDAAAYESRDDVLSMDEPHWDDFMQEAE